MLGCVSVGVGGVRKLVGSLAELPWLFLAEKTLLNLVKPWEAEVEGDAGDESAGSIPGNCSTVAKAGLLGSSGALVGVADLGGSEVVETECFELTLLHGIRRVGRLVAFTGRSDVSSLVRGVLAFAVVGFGSSVTSAIPRRALALLLIPE